MTGFQLKMLAVLFMTVDHIGAVFFPDDSAFRVIGRLSFPLIAWLLVEGYSHTKKVFNYLGRLLIFCILSEIPYLWAFNLMEPKMNIFFTLFLGLWGIHLFDGLRSKKFGYAAIVLLALWAELAPSDHGTYGLATIFVFYRFRHNFRQLVAAQVALNILRQAVVLPLALAGVDGLRLTEWWVWAQPVSLLALLFIAAYNGRQGWKVKYFFYFFYPIHLLVLHFLR